jgi:hypothetical protein
MDPRVLVVRCGEDSPGDRLDDLGVGMENRFDAQPIMRHGKHETETAMRPDSYETDSHETDSYETDTVMRQTVMRQRVMRKREWCR